MPAVDMQQRRSGLPLAPGLLWTGVGLAPVATLLVLFGGDSTGLMRLAVLLALIAVALIGVSLALRRDPDSMRDQVEDMLFEELDILREDVREDITTAARATHKAFGERVGALQESVTSLRGEFEDLRVRVERGGAPSRAVPPPIPPATAPSPPMTSAPAVVPPVVAPHGVVRHTETVKVTTRQTIVDQNDGGRGPGTVYGGNRVTEQPVVPAQRRPERAAPLPRDTDTGSGESWSEQLLRERLAEERRGGDRRDEARYEETRYGDDRSGSHSWSGERQDRWRASEPEKSDHSGRITGVHAGDRWTSVRSDDRGHEVRMGERRAAMEANGSGTELRIEDRWAAVRRDEVRRPEPHREPERQWERGRDSDVAWSREAPRDRESPRDREAGRDRPGRPEGSWSESRFGESRGEPTGSWGEPRPDRRGAQPALPAMPSQPSASSWMQGWDASPEPVSERVRPRPGDDGGYRWNGRDEEAPPARSPRSQGAGYDTGEERWR
jgi:hypothetical protein